MQYYIQKRAVAAPDNAHKSSNTASALPAVKALVPKAAEHEALSANTPAIQRKIEITNLHDVTFDESSSDKDIRDVAEYLFEEDDEYKINDITVENIVEVIKALAGEGDHKLKDYEVKDRVIEKFKKSESDSDERDQGGEEVLGEEGGGSSGATITLGKRTFDNDYWHHTLKQKIINTIGVKKLSSLVYKKKDKHNFDFWFGKNGEIWAGGNETGGHEKDTGWVLNEDHSITKG